ncbi:MAG: hypothetical protein QM778_29080 [Myxococcales bacterium]
MSSLRCADPSRWTRTLAPFLVAACTTFEPPLHEADGHLGGARDAGDGDHVTAPDGAMDQPGDDDADSMLDAGDGPEDDDGGTAKDAETPDASAADAGPSLPIPKHPTNLTKCGFAAPVKICNLTAPSLAEVSGMAVSRKNSGVFWVIEDSGNGSVVNAINAHGDLIGTYSFTGGGVDIEDVAVGPGPMAGESYLYIGDIGDNSGTRNSVTVYRAPEPVVDKDQSFVNAPLTGVENFPMQYPSGRFNAEAVMVDTNQDIYVITKDGFSRPNTVYRLSAPHKPATLRTLELVTTVYGGIGIDLAITAADMSADGSRIIVRSLHSATHWTRPPGMSVADTLDTVTPCDAELAVEDKGESVAFGPTGYYTTSENALSPLNFTSFSR